MISAELSITNPAMATAVPVRAFSSEITTGMSAPPIGNTMVTPRTSATAISDAETARSPNRRGVAGPARRTPPAQR